MGSPFSFQTFHLMDEIVELLQFLSFISQMKGKVPTIHKESACNAGAAGDMGLILGLGRFPWRGRHGYTLQYSCLENSMDREAWQAAIHGIAKSWTRLSD